MFKNERSRRNLNRKDIRKSQVMKEKEVSSEKTEAYSEELSRSFLLCSFIIFVCLYSGKKKKKNTI